MKSRKYFQNVGIHRPNMLIKEKYFSSFVRKMQFSKQQVMHFVLARGKISFQINKHPFIPRHENVYFSRSIILSFVQCLSLLYVVECVCFHYVKFLKQGNWSFNNVVFWYEAFVDIYFIKGSRTKFICFNNGDAFMYFSHYVLELYCTIKSRYTFMNIKHFISQ